MNMVKSLHQIVLFLAFSSVTSQCFAAAEMYLKIETQKGKSSPITVKVASDGSFSSEQLPAGDYKIWLIVNDEQFKIFSSSNAMHLEVHGQIVGQGKKNSKKLRLGAPITPLPKPMPILLGKLSLTEPSSINGKITIANQVKNPENMNPAKK